MKRRTFLSGALASLVLVGCRRSGWDGPAEDTAADPSCCDPQAYAISDGSGRVDYAPLFEPGIYRCIECGQPLFSSEAKYEAHTPWPSFWRALPGAVVPAVTLQTAGEDRDAGQISESVVACTSCHARLGDVYRDGPPPTGLRYCILSQALDFVPAAVQRAGQRPERG